MAAAKELPRLSEKNPSSQNRSRDQNLNKETRESCQIRIGQVPSEELDVRLVVAVTVSSGGIYLAVSWEDVAPRDVQLADEILPTKGSLAGRPRGGNDDARTTCSRNTFYISCSN